MPSFFEKQAFCITLAELRLVWLYPSKTLITSPRTNMHTLFDSWKNLTRVVSSCKIYSILLEYAKLFKFLKAWKNCSLNRFMAYYVWPILYEYMKRIIPPILYTDVHMTRKSRTRHFNIQQIQYVNIIFAFIGLHNRHDCFKMIPSMTLLI